MMTFIGFLATLLVFTTLTIQAQTAPSSVPQPPAIEHLIEELTKEVRTLRLALQQWHIEDARRMVVVEQYRVQHDRAASVSDRLELIRSELAEVRMDVVKAQEQIQAATERLRTNQDPDQQRILEGFWKDVNDARAQAMARETRLAEQERRMTIDADEQNRKLQSLELMLDSFLRPPDQR